VFIRVYRLEIQSVMLVFSTRLCELLTLSPSLWFIFPPPFPVSKYTVYTYTVCKGGDKGFFLIQINTCRKVPFQVNFFRSRHFDLPYLPTVLTLAEIYQVLIYLLVDSLYAVIISLLTHCQEKPFPR
jgi:hypothetical protein